ncbi:MAG TPA: D-alanyl-D-alanine carboxypeptidase, partial [Acidimicrobiia bacterium]|nr:D-alanyl-D-alanine carboxypeptidase [Acidimicrobiia bacterium]
MTRRKLSGFFLFAIACSVGAALIFAGLQPPSAPPAAVGAPQVQTPLWSPRRLPLFFTRAVESAALARAGDSLTKLLTTIVAPDRACVAVDSVGGSLVRIGSGTALTPASTLKLLTATAAIDRLGPDRRFTTRAFTDGADLVVVGGGDPLVATPEYIAFRHGEPRYQGAPFTPLTGLADAIVASGVHAISGALV